MAIDANHQHVNHSSDYPALPIFKFSSGITNYTNADFLLGYINSLMQGGQVNPDS